MSRMVGTVSRGIRAPIIRSGDDLAQIVTDSVLEAAAEDGFAIRDRDIVAMTEAIVARAQGNYATVDDIARDVRAKLGGGTVGVIFPILSRNRFAVCLRGIARGAKKVVLMLSYPSDEVGNHRAEVQNIGVLYKFLRHILFGKTDIGCFVSVKAEASIAFFVNTDKCKRGVELVFNFQSAYIYIFRYKRIFEHFAECVVASLADKSTVGAHKRSRNRNIGRCTAGVCLINGHAVFIKAFLSEVYKNFAY